MEDTKDLRAFLVEQMEAVAAGKLDDVKARGISNLAQQIYNTLNVEIRMAGVKRKVGDQSVKPVAFK